MAMMPDGVLPGVRERLVLALDVSSLDDAIELAVRLRPWFSVVKVGLELFSVEGPLALDALLDEGFRVLLDLKIHDSPSTVAGAARRLGAMGVSYLTVHSAGGEQMLRAVVDGFEEGWAASVAAGSPEPDEGEAGILAVASFAAGSVAECGLAGDRARLALRAGCLGVTCVVSDFPVVRSVAPGLLVVVPWVRDEKLLVDHGVRNAGALLAASAGDDLLLVADGVASSPDPEAAARDLASEVAAELGGSHVLPAS
jgi:orotidine-5'-phosphate decarboxylase